MFYYLNFTMTASYFNQKKGNSQRQNGFVFWKVTRSKSWYTHAHNNTQQGHFLLFQNSSIVFLNSRYFFHLRKYHYNLYSKLNHRCSITQISSWRLHISTRKREILDVKMASYFNRSHHSRRFGVHTRIINTQIHHSQIFIKTCILDIHNSLHTINYTLHTNNHLLIPTATFSSLFR